MALTAFAEVDLFFAAIGAILRTMEVVIREVMKARTLVFAFAFTLSACFRGSVPKSMTGTIQVRIVNASVGKICGLYATTEDSDARDAQHTWITQLSAIDRGGFREFNVKPGTYSFNVDVCTQFGSRLNAARPIRIQEAIEITMGDEHIALEPAPNLRPYKASFIAETCGSSGYNCNARERCCSGLRCLRDPSGGGVCR